MLKEAKCKNNGFGGLIKIKLTNTKSKVVTFGLPSAVLMAPETSFMNT